MPVTGWGEDSETPAMPQTSMLMARREHQASPLEIAQARSAADDARAAREAAASAPDPDQYAANFLARGYAPGMISQLSMQLAETTAELAGEEDKLEKAARRAERTRQMHERGQLDVHGIAARWQADVDEGDPAKVARLTRQADRLRGQIREAAELMAPPRAPEDPLEAASRRAHEAFVSATRARLEAAQAGRPAPRERRPFASASRGGVAVRSEHCIYCTREGLDDQTSYLLHSDPELNVPVTPPGQAAEAEQAEHAGYRSEFGTRVPMIYR